MTNIRTLTAWTQALAYLTRETPVRLSVAQLTMFTLVALGDRMGKPVNLTQLQDTLEGTPGGAMRTTYSIFFEKRRGVRNLGWLRQEPCREDMRVKWLRLTPKGARVLDTVLVHLDSIDPLDVQDLGRDDIPPRQTRRRQAPANAVRNA